LARATNTDILDKFRFTVKIDGFERLGFMSCTSPSYDISTREYPEGGNHLQPKQIIDSIKYVPVTLVRGVSTDVSFNKWATGFIDLVQGEQGVEKSDNSYIAALSSASEGGVIPVKTHKGNVLGIGFDTNDSFTYRRTVKIFHHNSLGQIVCAYFLYAAFPISYKPASDFDATTDDGVSVESLTLAYESFEVKYSGLAGALADSIQKSVK